MLWVVTAVGGVGAGNTAAFDTVKTTRTVTDTRTDQRTGALSVVAVDTTLVRGAANLITTIHW